VAVDEPVDPGEDLVVLAPAIRIDAIVVSREADPVAPVAAQVGIAPDNLNRPGNVVERDQSQAQQVVLGAVAEPARQVCTNTPGAGIESGIQR
jgi:hypothetical protein